MSPDLGRFLQPDPIGFQGDASNLYRYCGNDWANRTDPMGLFGEVNSENSAAAATKSDGNNARERPQGDTQKVDEAYAKAVQEFTAKSVEANKIMIARDKRLEKLNVPGAINQLINGIKNNPGQFTNLNQAKAAVTQVINALLQQRIRVGGPNDKFPRNNPMFTSNPDRNGRRDIVVNPKFINPGRDVRMPASHVGPLLAHEGKHMLEHPIPKPATQEWRAAENAALDLQGEFDHALDVNSLRQFDSGE